MTDATCENNDPQHPLSPTNSHHGDLPSFEEETLPVISLKKRPDSSKKKDEELREAHKRVEATEGRARQAQNLALESKRLEQRTTAQANTVKEERDRLRRQTEILEEECHQLKHSLEEQSSRVSKLGQTAEAARTAQQEAEEEAASANEAATVSKMALEKKEEQMRKLSDNFAAAVKDYEERIAALKARIDELEQELTDTKGEKKALETRVRDLEGECDAAEARLTLMVTERTREIRSSMETTITRYRELAAQAEERAAAAEEAAAVATDQAVLAREEAANAANVGAANLAKSNDDIAERAEREEIALLHLQNMIHLLQEENRKLRSECKCAESLSSLEFLRHQSNQVKSQLQSSQEKLRKRMLEMSDACSKAEEEATLAQRRAAVAVRQAEEERAVRRKAEDGMAAVKRQLRDLEDQLRRSEVEVLSQKSHCSHLSEIVASYRHDDDRMRKDLRRLRERLAAAEANSASDAAKCVRLQADLRQLETRMDEEVQHYGEVAKRSEMEFESHMSRVQTLLTEERKKNLRLQEEIMTLETSLDQVSQKLKRVLEASLDNDKTEDSLSALRTATCDALQRAREELLVALDQFEEKLKLGKRKRKDELTSLANFN